THFYVGYEGVILNVLYFLSWLHFNNRYDVVIVTNADE
ncbi:MAG: hypothetical protein ACI9X8_001626, partial [Pseudoalteromonas distincta]